VRLRDGLAITLAARGLELDSAYRMLAEITDERPWHPSLNDDTGVATLKAGYLPEVQWHHTRAEPFSHGDGLRTRARHMLREVAEKKRSSAQRHVSQGLAAVALQEGHGRGALGVGRAHWRSDSGRPPPRVDAPSGCRQ
jgi:hypothetical protein